MPIAERGTVNITVLEQTKSVPSGTTVAECLPGLRDPKGYPYLGAIANNRLVSLDAPLSTDTQLTPVIVRHPAGASIYRRCSTYLLFAAFAELYPDRKLQIGQSMGNGYHFRVNGNGNGKDGKHEPIDLQKVTARMRRFVDEKAPFEHQVLPIELAEDLFAEKGRQDKVRLLRVWPSGLVHVVSLGEFTDIDHGPVPLDASAIDDFELIAKEPGFILHFSSLRSPVWRGEPWTASEKLFETYNETRVWNEILGVDTVGDLNELCLNGGVLDIIRITEGFHEKKIARIADMISERPDVRLVLIAGPSSSGKTTFSKRLAIQMRVNGIRPKTVSLDNYYVDREQTPRHPDGTFDFEAVEAIDLALFNEQLAALLDGQEIKTPKFDFNTGLRTGPEKWQPMRLDEGEVLMIEGIHGLNDRLTESIPSNKKFRIFVSALTQLVLDSANRIPTSDARLIRRIVRDRRYRGYSAAETIASWASVRRGERRNIFPFQDHSDVMFNSALVYEPAVLKVLADRYLLEVPRDHPSAVTAHSLRKFLQLFVPIFIDDVPRGSILREFIGGAFFHY